MQLTGPGIWGEPKGRAEALRVLRRAVELGVDFIDTADSYGPSHLEDNLAAAEIELTDEQFEALSAAGG